MNALTRGRGRLGLLVVGLAVLINTTGISGAAPPAGSTGARYTGSALPYCPTDLVGIGRRILVGLDPTTPTPTLLRRAGARQVGAIPALKIGVFELPTRAQVAPTLAALRGQPGVRWAEADHAVQASRTTNDPLLARQWSLKVIGVPRAWDKQTGFTNPVTVAVLDTGIDATHPDLAGQVLPGYDLITPGGQGGDDAWHGTAVAGVIAADANNHLGMAGISWGARLLPIKVLDASGAGDDCTATAGMVIAMEDGARVLNLSFGEGTTVGCPSSFAAAVELANFFGALIVAAAGNDAQRGNPREFPAACPGVLSVGATDQHDRLAPFSERNDAVAISAPGVSVLTTYRDPRTGAHGYAYVSGTSLAAPMVSGVAALLMSAYPTWGAAQIADQLMRTSRDLGPRGRDSGYGVGRLDAAKALA